MAPIVLFVYNRPLLTQKVVEALSRNEEAKCSDLFIFSDAAKNDDKSENVKQVRNYIKTIRGFKSITIKEQTQNQGLAKSIIDGVTEVVNKFGKIIVLEDDIETSPYFLKFMNDALNFYENEKRVWNVTAYQFPVDTSKLPNAFFSYFSSCWSWGTWKDRWAHFDKNPDKYISQMSKKDIHRFDYYGTNEMYSQIVMNKTGQLNTWAIFWYVVQFVNNGLALFPSKSLVNNIGMDCSGTHCAKTDMFNNNIDFEKTVFDFSAIPIEENKIYIKIVCNYFRKYKTHKTILENIKKILKKVIKLCFQK